MALGPCIIIIIIKKNLFKPFHLTIPFSSSSSLVLVAKYFDLKTFFKPHVVFSQCTCVSLAPGGSTTNTNGS